MTFWSVAYRTPIANDRHFGTGIWRLVCIFKRIYLVINSFLFQISLRSKGSSWQYVNIGWGDGFVSNRRQCWCDFNDTIRCHQAKISWYRHAMKWMFYVWFFCSNTNIRYNYNNAVFCRVHGISKCLVKWLNTLLDFRDLMGFIIEVLCLQHT